jgi:hypothetical protein
MVESGTLSGSGVNYARLEACHQAAVRTVVMIER